MRRILIVLLMLTTGVAHARVLHVGENTIKLSQTKTTTPALHVRVGDEVWYGMMYPFKSVNTLHVNYNNVNYTVLQCKPFTDTTNYTYDESGRLIGANENVFLKTQPKIQMRIDTGIAGNNKNLAFEIKYKWNVLPKANQYTGLFGNYNAPPYEGEQQNTTRLIFYNDIAYINIDSMADNSPGYTFKQIADTVYNVRISAQEQTVYNIPLTKSSGTISNGLENTSNIVLFNGANVYHDYYSDNEYVLSVYSFQIWDNDTLVRHFVPVPCGLKIGDFVVPENGMWDIVEQKFYGNMGADEFIYGIDMPTSVDLNNYTFDTDGKLIDVNENVYLDSGTNINKGNFINTGVPGGNDNLSFEIKYKIISDMPKNTYWATFGNYNGENENTTRLLFYNTNTMPYVNNKASTAHLFSESRPPNQIYTEWFDKNEFISNGVKKSLRNTIAQGTPNNNDICLFTGFHQSYILKNMSFIGKYAIYHFKIWDNDVLVRHFVPVPCGLKIGDFVVPENGMWDIVEQKFYGNMGTGEFIYGVDG